MAQMKDGSYDKYKNMKLILIILIAFFAIVAVAGVIFYTQYNKRDPYEEYRVAREQINSGHYKEGIVKIEELLEEDVIPDADEEALDVLDEARHKLADEYYNDGKAEDAFDLYDELDDQEGKDKSEKLLCKQKILANDLEEAESIIDGYFDGKKYKETAKELKYDYCKMSQDPSNDTFAEYIWELAKAKYKDSKEVNDGIYKPKAKIVVNDSKKNETKKKSNVSVYDTIYFHIEITGLNPNDDKGIRLKSIGYFPDGEPQNYKFKGRWTNESTGWASMYYYDVGTDGSAYGEVKFYVYNRDTNEIIGTATANFV